MHVESGFDNPLDDCIRIDLALRAIAISSEGPKQKLPVTLQLLASVKKHLDDTYNSKLLWAAMTLAHFGLLRAKKAKIIYCIEGL